MVTKILNKSSATSAEIAVSEGPENKCENRPTLERVSDFGFGFGVCGLHFQLEPPKEMGGRGLQWGLRAEDARRRFFFLPAELINATIASLCACCIFLAFRVT